MSKTRTNTKGKNASNRLDDQELDGVVGGTVAARMSTGFGVAVQTAKRDFGDRMAAGLEGAAGLVANGASVVGGIVPGGAIVSAAVSSVGAMTNNVTPGGGAAAASYAATG